MRNEQKILQEFTGYFGLKKATEIVHAICERVIAFRCKEHWNREKQLRDYEHASIAPSEWSTENQIENKVAFEVAKEANDYFESLCNKYRQIALNKEVY